MFWILTRKSAFELQQGSMESVYQCETKYGSHLLKPVFPYDQRGGNTNCKNGECVDDSGTKLVGPNNSRANIHPYTMRYGTLWSVPLQWTDGTSVFGTK